MHVMHLAMHICMHACMCASPLSAPRRVEAHHIELLLYCPGRACTAVIGDGEEATRDPAAIRCSCSLPSSPLFEEGQLADHRIKRARDRLRRVATCQTMITWGTGLVSMTVT